MSEEALLLAVYKENADQARQHELFRQTITTLVAGVTGAVIGLSLKDAATIINNPLLTIAGTFLAIIGTYGLIACAKHYERNRMHVERLREIRHRLDTLPGITPGILTAINSNADFRHKLHYSRLYRVQLNKVWNTFHVLVILLGITLAIFPYSNTLRTIITPPRGTTSRHSPCPPSQHSSGGTVRQNSRAASPRSQNIRGLAEDVVCILTHNGTCREAQGLRFASLGRPIAATEARR